MVFCERCGEENKDNAKFCSECGSKIDLMDTIRNTNEYPRYTVKRSDSMVSDIKKMVDDYTFVPGKEIIETDYSILVRMELPGTNENDINIDLTEKKIKISAKLDEEYAKRSNKITHHDRKAGFIRRSVRFPKKVVPEEAEAKYENGVLTVKVLKEGWMELKEQELEQDKKLELLKNLYVNGNYNDVKELFKDLLSYSVNNFNTINTIVEMGEPIIEYIIECTKSNDPVVRGNACDVLSNIGGPQVVMPIVQLISDDVPYIRLKAVNAYQNDFRFIEPLINALNDYNFEVRLSAIRALGDIGDQRAVEPLNTIINMPDDNHLIKQILFGNEKENQLREAAKTSLEELKLKKEYELRTKQEEYKKALNTLITLYEDENYEGAHKFINENFIKDLESHNEDIQDLAAIILTKIGNNAIDTLIEALKSPNEDVRGYAAAVLGNIKNPRALDPLIEALEHSNDCNVRPHANDPEWNVKMLIVQALGEIGNSKAVIPLKNALKDPYKDVRLNALIALGKIGNPNVDPFLKALEDPAKSVRAVAAEILGELGDERAIWHLVNACKDTTYPVRLEAVKALGELGDPRGCDELYDSARCDYYQDIRLAAVESLYKIGDKTRGKNVYWNLEFIVKNDDDPVIRKAAADALLDLGRKN